MALRATKGDEDARCGRTLWSFLVVCGRRAWRFRCFFPCLQLQPSGGSAGSGPRGPDAPAGRSRGGEKQTTSITRHSLRRVTAASGYSQYWNWPVVRM